jgi:hypothetical protein
MNHMKKNREDNNRLICGVPFLLPVHTRPLKHEFVLPIPRQ